MKILERNKNIPLDNGTKRGKEWEIRNKLILNK